MTKQTINVGTSPNDNRGDSLRASFQKINANFTELYTALGLDVAPLNLGAFEFAGSTLSTTDSSAIVIDQAVTVSSNLTVGGDVLPSVANGGDLGSSARPWRSLYVSNNTIFLGGVPLSLDPETNELNINNIPISQRINYADIPNAPTDVSDLTDTDELLGGGGGLSITDFGEGFTDSLDAGKITTSKLYNENPNQGLNNLYVLEVTNGGVVVLPDGSIINGATLKTVPGNYAGITAGPASPAGKDEDSWVWVDNNGATIATKYSTDAHTWTFNNDGELTFPNGGQIANYPGGVGASNNSWFVTPGSDGNGGVSSQDGQQYIQINNNLPVEIGTSYGTENESIWRFGADGDLAIPPGKTIRDAMTGNDLLDIRVVRQDTAPTAANGTLWFNTVEGRLYIKYSDQWVDAAPLVQPLPDTDLDVNSITFPDATVQTSAYSDRLINNNWTVFFGEFGQLLVRNTNTEQNYFNLTPIENEDDTYGVQIGINNQASWTFLDNGNLTLPGEQQIGGSDGTQGIALTTDRGTVLFGNTPEQCVPTQSSHFHIMRDDPTTVDLFFGDDFNYVKLPYDSTLTNVGVQIGTDATNLWSFGKDGNLTVPGDILSEGNINIEVNLSDSTLRRWQFGEDGNLTLPAGGDILDSNGNSVLDSGDSNVWVQTFETQSGAPTDIVAIAFSVEYDSAGNVIALFSHFNDDNLSTYYSVGKYTTTGAKIWTARFDDEFNTDGWGLAVDNDSDSIYVAGESESEGGQVNATLTKIDSTDGSVIWSKIYDFGFSSRSSVVDVASDGDPVMVGYASNGTDDYVATTKVDAADGSIIWSRALDGQADEEAYGMAVGPSGEVVAIGYMDQLGADDSSVLDDRMLVVKYDSTGSIQWQKAVQFDANQGCRGADADIDADGNIYVCGNYDTEIGVAMSLVKFNSSGVEQWSRRIVGNCVDFATSVVVGPDNNLYLSGVTTAPGDETVTWVVAKYSTTGSVVWQRLIENTASWTFTGSLFFENAGGSNIAVGPDYVLLGGGFGTLDSDEDPTATVVQIDTNGTLFSIGNWALTAASFTGNLDDSASDITVVNAGKANTDNAENITTSTVTLTTEVSGFLIGTLYTAPGGNDSLVNGANELLLEANGAVTLPQGGTISEGYVTSNPTIQLTPATPSVASQKLVIKGGGTFSTTENGITVTVPSNTWTEGNVDYVYVEAPTRVGQTLYWWIYPEGADLSTPSTGTVILDEMGDGLFSLTLDSDAYEFRVRVSPEEDNYDPANVGVQSVLINSGSPTFEGEHHLHLTTGDLTETSIFLGTDDHNVRTTTDGKIQITTPSEGNNVWEFGTDGSLTLPASGPILFGGNNCRIQAGQGFSISSDGGILVEVANEQWLFGPDGDLEIPGDIKSNGNINIDINLSDSTLRRWQFGEDGELTFPDASVQTTAYPGGGYGLPVCVINSSDGYGQGGGGEVSVNFTVTNPSGAAITEIGIFLPNVTTEYAVQLAASNTAGTQDKVLSNLAYGDRYWAQVYAVTANGTAYSKPNYLAPTQICLLAGTMIAMADGTHKAIEDITYTDRMLSWDFDRGCYAETTALWIKRCETGSQYNLLTFSDGTTLRTFDQHRIFNKQAGAFTYPMTDATPIGTITVNEHGEEITLISKQVVVDTIEYYNVITDHHMNLFSDTVLTSCRFNNIYPILDMKFVKDSRILRTRDEFENIPDRFFYGLRLAEQTYDLDMIEWYVTRLLSVEQSFELAAV
jgi:hypothetical protein